MEPQSDNTPSSAPQPTTAEQDEIISWTKQRQQQAQQRILETLMYSGAGQEEKPVPRRRKKKNNNQQETKEQINSKEFDVEEALKSIMGNEYKSVSKKKRNKKKKKRKNKPQAKQQPKEQPRVKTAEERMYRSATSTGRRNELTVDFEVAGLTVCGDYTLPGIQIPERAMCFEASGMTGTPAQNVFISSCSPKNLYGFCYQAESAELICCSNAMVDGLESLLQSWQMILNPQKFEAEMVVEEDEEPQDDEEDVANEEERESDEEEEEEDDDEGPFATFPSTGESHMYLPEISLQAHAFDSGNDSLAYSFSTDQNPKRYLLTYIANANQPFLRKQTNILNSNAVVMNCTFLDKNVEDMESGQISWTQISSFILDNPETTFLLNCFDSGLSHSDIYSFFSSLVLDGEVDLSNVILFIPPQENQL